MKRFTTRRSPEVASPEWELPSPFPLAPRDMPDPQPGDILLFTHAQGLNQLIPWFTGSRYYHCGLYEGDGFSLEARPNGVVRRNLLEETGDVFRVIRMPRQGVDKALHFARARLGSVYDPLDIAFIIVRHKLPLLHLRYSNHRAFTCGELVARAWRAGGCDLFPDKQASEIIPADYSRFLPRDARDQVLEAT